MCQCAASNIPHDKLANFIADFLYCIGLGRAHLVLLCYMLHCSELCVLLQLLAFQQISIPLEFGIDAVVVCITLLCFTWEQNLSCNVQQCQYLYLLHSVAVQHTLT